MPIYRFAKRKPKSSMDELKIVYTFPDGILHASTTGNVNIILDLMRKDLDQCDILIVEDIIDSGRTLSHLVQYLKLKGAHSVKTCTLLDKPYRREVPFTVDYVGKEIPDEFVVGYGLDYNERYRALPYVGVLKRSVYEKE